MSETTRNGKAILSGLLLAAALAPAAAAGQVGAGGAGSDSTRRALRLDRIVVTATRTGMTVREVPVAVTLVEPEALARASAQTLPDLLRQIPGLTMRDYQSSVAAHPTRTAPSLRGLGGGTASGRTLVLVDGMPMADPFAGWVHWARVPLALVEQIEVVRGGASGVWGSRAMGGVINLLTEPARTRGATFSLQGGSHSTVRAGALGTWRGSRLGLSAMAEFFDADGFIGVRSDLRGPIDKPAGGRHEVAFAKLQYDVSPAFALHLSGSYLDESRSWGTALRDFGLTLGHVRVAAQLVRPGGAEWKFDLFGSTQNSNSTFTTETLDRTAEAPSLDQFDVPATSIGASAQWFHRKLGAHQLAAGADIFAVQGEVGEDFVWQNDAWQRRRRVGGDQVLGGIWLQDVFTPAEGWHAMAAARYDVARHTSGFRRETAIASGAVLIDSTYTDGTESAVNFSIGLRRDVSAAVSLHGNLFRAYRAPTLNELYKPFREPGNVVAESNARLDAERAFGGEFGATIVAGSAATVRLTAFWTRVESPIIEATVDTAGRTGRVIAPCGFVPAGGVCRERRNLGAFRTAGLEAELEWQPSTRWMMAGAWTWNPTKVLDAPTNPELEGLAAPRTAEHTFTGTLQWADPAVLDVAMTVRAVGERYEDDLNSLPLDPFVLLDLRLARALPGGWEIFGTVENLLDAEFETAHPSSGLVRVGAPRTALAGVRVRFRR